MNYNIAFLILVFDWIGVCVGICLCICTGFGSDSTHWGHNDFLTVQESERNRRFAFNESFTDSAAMVSYAIGDDLRPRSPLPQFEARPASPSGFGKDARVFCMWLEHFLTLKLYSACMSRNFRAAASAESAERCLALRHRHHGDWNRTA